jgi:two-component system KDP operon response regulator KdpE
MEVLIVNPQPVWAERIQARLDSVVARALVAHDWASAEELLQEESPDILIIEHRILEKEAASLMDSLREWEWLPLIVPTAFAHLGTESQVSPHGEEALRRLEMIVIRLQGVFLPAERHLIRVGKLTIDPTRKEVVFAARRIPLPPNQFRLLLYLALNAGRVVEQRELVRELWGFAGTDSEARQLIKTHVRSIRHNLGWTDESVNYLHTVRGFGYMVSPPSRARSRANVEPATPAQSARPSAPARGAGPKATPQGRAQGRASRSVGKGSPRRTRSQG